MNLFNYASSKKIILTDSDNAKWVGSVEDVIPAEDNDDGLDSIVIRADPGCKYEGQLIEFPENEVKSIQILD